MATGAERLELSRYLDVCPLKTDGSVMLTRDTRTGTLYVKKTMATCHRDVCRWLFERPVAGMPVIRFLADFGDCLILIEDYINGRTLQNRLDLEGPLPEEEAFRILRLVGETVSRLHALSPAVIHRDIKPENVLLSPDGGVWLTDLDAAKPLTAGQSRDTVLLGTAGYAAPEQYGFQGSGVATDVYALGVLLNVMLTGALPNARLAAGKAGKVVQKATRMDPENRYLSVRDMLSDIFGREIAGKTGWRRFLPPGLGGRDPANTVLAAAGYLLLLYLTCTVGFDRAYGQTDLWMNRLTMFFAVMNGVLFFGNYLNVQNKLGLGVRPDGKKPTGRILLTGIALILLPVFLLVIGEMIVLGDLNE